MTDFDPVDAAEVLAQLARAIPVAARGEIIICGSLAAAYYFRDLRKEGIRTKDVDALLSPNAKAVATAVHVTERLIDAAWALREDERFGRPGTAQDAVDTLPMVRLKPPHAAASSRQWFLELMAAPVAYRADGDTKQWQRVSTRHGDFALCSFQYLALVEHDPIPTEHGLLIARPELMALANLLHHPRIADAVIVGSDGDKRSNKDLGRVIALAFLGRARDLAFDADDMDAWAGTMAAALRTKFGADAGALALRAGAGIEALLNSPIDLSQALAITNRSLLAGMNVGLDGFAATARRLQATVLEPLARAF